LARAPDDVDGDGQASHGAMPSEIGDLYPDKSLQHAGIRSGRIQGRSDFTTAHLPCLMCTQENTPIIQCIKNGHELRVVQIPRTALSRQYTSDSDYEPESAQEEQSTNRARLGGEPGEDGHLAEYVGRREVGGDRLKHWKQSLEQLKKFLETTVQNGRVCQISFKKDLNPPLGLDKWYSRQRMEYKCKNLSKERAEILQVIYKQKFQSRVMHLPAALRYAHVYSNIATRILICIRTQQTIGVKLQGGGAEEKLNAGKRSKNGPKIERPKEGPKIKRPASAYNLFVAHHVNTECEYKLTILSIIYPSMRNEILKEIK